MMDNLVSFVKNGDPMHKVCIRHDKSKQEEEADKVKANGEEADKRKKQTK